MKVEPLYLVAILDANGTNGLWEDIYDACTDTIQDRACTIHDRLGGLNRYTGDGAKQKIKTVPAILLNNRMLTATFNFQAYRKQNTF